MKNQVTVILCTFMLCWVLEEWINMKYQTEQYRIVNSECIAGKSVGVR